VTTVAEEKAHNPRLTKNLEQFTKIMEDLKLPYPKEIGKFLLPRGFPVVLMLGLTNLGNILIKCL
jgi:hypothetical protein